MALIMSTISQKAVSATLPGELFRMELRGGAATCVTLENADPRRLVIGVLNMPELGRPIYVLNPAATTMVASFGMQWAIEPIVGPEAYPSSGYHHDDARVLFLQDGDAILRFDRSDQSPDFESVNASLMGNGRVDRAHHAVPFRKWRIWQSAGDRDRANAQPLVQFG